MNENIDSEIYRLYMEGYTYNEISLKLGVTRYRIKSIVKGLKTASEIAVNARTRGRVVLTDDGRRRLSESAKRTILKGSKVWTKPEKAFKDLLESIGIGVKIPDCLKDICGDGDAYGDICFQYPLQRYICDFVDPKMKIVYHVHGDFWHANPVLYSRDKLCKIQLNNMRHDMNRQRYLEEKGYLNCIIWESEIYWNQQLVIDKIRATREQGNPFVLHTKEARIVTEVAHQPDWSSRLNDIWFKTKKPKEIKLVKLSICPKCNKEFKALNNRIKFCSRKCARLSQRKTIIAGTDKRPDRETLEREIKEMSWVALGKKYSVSDNAVKKWARVYGLDIPVRRKRVNF